MSADVEMSETSDTMMHCASCGIAEVDEIKLKTCTACKSVRYCGVTCQREHKVKHKKACKKRAAELRDEILFKQPEGSYLGDCPICCLPLSINVTKSTLMDCCSKLICNGCSYANKLREAKESLKPKCPFCRHPAPESDREIVISVMKRIEVNDPVAMCYMGKRCQIEGDYKGAFEYWDKAAELGNIYAHFNLSNMYREGDGVERDKKKELHHLEQAAIGGDPDSRYNLGCLEDEYGRMDRAVKHWIISANRGHDDSIHNLKECFKGGYVSKEDLAAALRAHQAAVDATKSPQRDEAEAALQKMEAADAARQN
jgi:hypothetical protein